MKSPLKNLKKYFQLIMTALICFLMGVIEDKKRICIKDTDSKKDRTVLRPDDKKNNRKNKIIYWNEPRIQNRINRAVYFNTGLHYPVCRNYRSPFSINEFETVQQDFMF